MSTTTEPTTLHPAVAFAIKRQRGLGESDARFAARFGITGQHWGRLRRGEREPGEWVVNGIRRWLGWREEGEG